MRGKLPIVDLVVFALRKADPDQQNEADGQAAPVKKGSSPKSPTSLMNPQIWAMLDGLRLILSSTYLLYVSLFLWLSAVVSSFFYFQVRYTFFFTELYFEIQNHPHNLYCILNYKKRWLYMHIKLDYNPVFLPFR